MSTHNKEAAERGTPAIDAKLIAELDWCIENGHQGERSRNLLRNLRAALTASEAPATEAPPQAKLIGREPTEEMLVAADESDRKYSLRVYGDETTGKQGPYDHWVSMWDAARSEQAPAGEVPSDMFEEWAKREGLIQESSGLRSENSMLPIARKAWNAAALATPPAVPPGWKLVPAEPTPEMIRAAHECLPPVSRKWHAAIKEKYAAMLSAAPAAPPAVPPKSHWLAFLEARAAVIDEKWANESATEIAKSLSCDPQQVAMIYFRDRSLDRKGREAASPTASEQDQEVKG